MISQYHGIIYAFEAKMSTMYGSSTTNEQAKQIATKAVAAAMERDPGSGNGIDVLVIPNLVVVKEEKR
jgi:proteasome beta subunit